MSTNSQVNTTNQGSTSTAAAPAPAPTTSSTSVTQKSGQALAGALWEALSEMTAALNECISIENKIGLQACTAANTMTDAKATADRKKSQDSALQYYFDAGSKLLGAACTLGGAVAASKANATPSAELDGINTKLTKFNGMKTDLNTEPLPIDNGNGMIRAGRGPAAADAPRVNSDVEDRRLVQLKNGSVDDLNDDSLRVDDKALIQRTQGADRDVIRANINKRMKELEQNKNTRESQRNFNQTSWDMHTQIASSFLDATAGGLKAWKQGDIGQDDYDSAEASNVQQQMSSLIGSAGSAQSSMANSSSQAIQAYAEMEKANANSSR
jgi:hypothetical protein